jgi:hypothetical protein
MLSIINDNISRLVVTGYGIGLEALGLIRIRLALDIGGGG